MSKLSSITIGHTTSDVVIVSDCFSCWWTKKGKRGEEEKRSIWRALVPKPWSVTAKEK